jgi:hypothetical protein
MSEPKNEFQITGNWNNMVPIRLTVPEPVYNILEMICQRKGKTHNTDEVRDMISQGIEQQTGINILKIKLKT